MRKVLLVDDDKPIREFLKVIFEKKGFDVTVAEDGMVAITEAKTEMPDLIVMDMNMPVLTGFKAARELKKEGVSTADIPIIALTAHKTAEDHTEAHMAGCDAFVEKPIVAKHLFEVVYRVLS